MKMFKQATPALVAAAVALTAGCSHMKSSPSDAQAALQQKEREVATLQSELAASKSQAKTLQTMLDSGSATATAASEMGGDLFPPNAQAGECFARVLVPAKYETKTEQVLKRAASDRVEIIPAKYEWVEEQVLIREASERIEVIPATYDYVEEQMLVKPASSRLVEVPAEYGWEEEKILVKPAHQVWKKGRGPIERLDNTTGEILCLVEVPAQYKTVRKKVVKQAAGSREVSIPAEYKTVRKKIVKSPATTRTVAIPAEYKTMKVRKVVSPAQEKRIPIAEEYETITKRVQLSQDHMEWRPILCETNTNPGTVRAIQNALKTAGFNPGPVDGQLGSQTYAAIAAYQRSKNLPTGGLTMNTLKSLGVVVR